jgi:UDP-2,3-diacylglucosamine hydrolase
MKRPGGEEPPYMGENREFLVLYTKKYIQFHPNVDYFIYGHRHIEVDLQLTRRSRMIILGDWISHFSYVVFDGEHLFMSQYIEGESIM